MNAMEKRWQDAAQKRLLGRTITEVRYMSADEAKGSGWYERPLAIVLDDGSFLVPMRDDEGNGGGAMFWQKGSTEEVMPVLGLDS